MSCQKLGLTYPLSPMTHELARILLLAIAMTLCLLIVDMSHESGSA